MKVAVKIVDHGGEDTELVQNERKCTRSSLLMAAHHCL